MNRVHLAEVVSYTRRAPLKLQRHFAFPQKRNGSTFAQFFQLREKVRARQVALVPPKFLPIPIENDQGESCIILACQLKFAFAIQRFARLPDAGGSRVQ
jgi:hypothetical protein